MPVTLSTRHRLDQQIRQLIAASLPVTKGDLDQSQIELSVPPQASMGDIAVPCFQFAAAAGMSPQQVAQALAERIKPFDGVERVVALGPYCNFFLHRTTVVQGVLQDIANQRQRYGSQPKHKSKPVVIEFGGQNTHKEIHIGHVRNLVLGQSLINLFTAVGLRAIPINYINDTGAHVARTLWGLRQWPTKGKLPARKGSYLGAVYARVSQHLEDHPDDDLVVKKLNVDFNNGNRTLRALWKKTRAWSIAEFAQVYADLQVTFRRTFYDHSMDAGGKKMVKDLLKKKIAVVSDGATIVNLEDQKLGVFVVLRTDGTPLYSTKDLGLALTKQKAYPNATNYVLTDQRQAQHFAQLFTTLKRFGYKAHYHHLPYEFVTLASGVMSSRKGNVIGYWDFRDELVKLTAAETNQRHPQWSAAKVAKTAKAIAMAAFKFELLKVKPGTKVVFDPTQALDFNGYSGPYILYTISRINTLTRKAPAMGGVVDTGQLTTEIEWDLVCQLVDYPAVVAAAQATTDPSEVAHYAFELAQLFSRYYQDTSILQSTPKVRAARLVLVGAVRQVLINALSLLGISPVTEM